jgi:hypothetical protein
VSRPDRASTNTKETNAMARMNRSGTGTALICLMLCLGGCGSGGGGGGGSADAGTTAQNATSPQPQTPAGPQVEPPSITAQPTARTVNEGAVASFSVSATGGAPLAYGWQYSADRGATWTSAPGMATSSSYTTSATTVANDGFSYRVLVSNAAGTVASAAALLTVVPTPRPPSVERQVNATVTGSGITAAPAAGEAPHLAINPSPAVAARGKLLVFIPGTQGRPSQYSYLLRAGASRGFHAVGVNYPNQVAMGTLCQTSADPGCYWNARNVVVFGGGTPVSGQSPVTPADSIVNRLNRLLVWLHANQPSEGWDQYLLVDQTVDWRKVVLAGHSQGGGHVGVLAKSVELARAVYFSSPEDWNDLTDQAARWTSTRPNVTPADRQYGFGSDADTLVPNSHAFVHWDGLGLTRPPSGPVSVDAAAAPFSGSRQLRTGLSYNPASTAPTLALRNHGITVVDVSTPVDGSGRPLFDVNGVWQYLCFD